MNSFATVVRKLLVVLVCAGAWLPSRTPGAQPAGSLLLVAKQGRVEVLPPGTARTNWVACETNQLLQAQWRLRTRENSRATLQWPDLSVVSYGEMAEVEVLSPSSATGSGLRLIKGILSFLHKDEPGDIRVITRGANAGIKGTEFVIAVEDINGVERTTLSVIDGVVSLTNEFGALVLTNGQQAVVDFGQAPVLQTAGFLANNLLQWAFYYPAVLDLRDLPLAPAEQQALAGSLAAYRSGDLLAALENYPAGHQLATDAERVYQAALFLSVGQVQKTEAALAALPAGEPTAPLQRLATALRQLIAAVKRQPNPAATPPQLPTELLAASYYEQSRAVGEDSLRSALALARQAAVASPEFSFAWARVAELEFSFGRTGAAADALAKSLALAERNAQALALQGFLHAARNRTRVAAEWFDRAIAADPALGNAWLGRGLIRIRRGDARGGRADLMVAAALEPQRASLRSYLGKALSLAGDTPRARHELELAKRLDPADPTPWLYSALLNEQNNRLNEGIRDLDKSQELNDNRRLYRSKLLLDQDRAVGSASLANIYRDAGMTDWSVREAGRAVSADYANYSAHLFLANSYDELRDPNRVNLRYETAAESEYLIANLLAPVGAGTLAQSISQQEYSKLFERDRLGVASSTEYLSRGAWVENGAQFGTFRHSSYAVEALYRFDPGQRPGGDFEHRELRLHLKQELTPQDSVYFRAIDLVASGGDVLQYYDPRRAVRGLRTREIQDPILSVGYHHEWSPGVHTLLLTSRLSDRYAVTNPAQDSLFVIKANGATPSYVQPIGIRLDYRNTLEIYSAELQQIWQVPKWSTVVGVRFQTGEFQTQNRQADPMAGDNVGFFPTNGTAALQDMQTDYQRLSIYGYQHWQVADELRLVGGVSYDRVTFGSNRRLPPLSEEEETVDRVSPKAGLVWMPRADTVLRFAYTRSLAGASVGQAFQLEPTEVAGFNQAFRSVIPESVAGASDGARFETYGLSLERRFSRGTYLGLAGETLNSRVNRTVGIFEFTDAHDFTVPSNTREHLDFGEKSLVVTVDQLLSRDWAVGVRYRLTAAELDNDFVEVPDRATKVGGFRPRAHLEAILHQLNLHLNYNHPGGFFAQFQGLWNQQSNRGYTPGQPSDDFWQLNAFAGWRFLNRRAEVRVGLLNLTGQNYRLNPLTLYDELPRERTFAARLSFKF